MQLYLNTGEGPEGDDGDRLFVKHADARQVIDALQALLNERDAEIGRLRTEPTAALLIEALEWVTEKPWDDGTFLHYRISNALGLPVAYPEWDYSL